MTDCDQRKLQTNKVIAFVLIALVAFCPAQVLPARAQPGNDQIINASGAELPTTPRHIASRKREYVVGSSLGMTKLSLDDIACVDIADNNAIYGEPYNDRAELHSIIRKYWPRVKLAGQLDSCQFVLSFSVVGKEVRSVRHRGIPATTLMSFQVCRRDAGSNVNPNLCLYKNLYLFEHERDKRKILQIAIEAFATKQTAKWSVINIATSDN
jgi:hypothetical protein